MNHSTVQCGLDRRFDETPAPKSRDGAENEVTILTWLDDSSHVKLGHLRNAILTGFGASVGKVERRVRSGRLSRVIVTVTRAMRSNVLQVGVSISYPILAVVRQRITTTYNPIANLPIDPITCVRACVCVVVFTPINVLD
jgi:hypothetical protein